MKSINLALKVYEINQFNRITYYIYILKIKFENSVIV